jgi:hypothetical protein
MQHIKFGTDLFINKLPAPTVPCKKMYKRVGKISNTLSILDENMRETCVFVDETWLNRT